MQLIAFSQFSYRYPGNRLPVLNHLSVEIEEGEFVLVMGPSGVGKSTFLRALNGLVPHFYGGEISGRLRVAGLDPVVVGPREMSAVVGFVQQDPEDSFVVDRVEAELVFAMENQAVSPLIMRKRVEEVLDQLSIAALRQRPIATLSGGEKQRVAIAAALTLQPRLLVLDEPTSQLDPQSAEDVLTTLRRLNEDLGLTVIVSEHRLERVLPFADRVIAFTGPGEPPLSGRPEEVITQVDLVPPLVSLGKALGWQPLPLTVKKARRFARELSLPERAPAVPTAPGPPLLQVNGLWFRYNGKDVLRDTSLQLPTGGFLALMGRNGAGKTTLLKQIVGLLRPQSGQVRLFPGTASALDVKATPLPEIIRHVGMVPQNPGAFLFQERVLDELAVTRRNHSLPSDETADMVLLDRLSIAHLAARHPRDLSSGEQQRVALASILVVKPQLLLLDEPTRGLDYHQKAALLSLLRSLQAEGMSIIMATHDVELVAQAAEQVALMAEGEVILTGPTDEVMTESLLFAPQINKLLRVPGYLTVEDVLAALPTPVGKALL